jgi:hypothetical protein
MGVGELIWKLGAMAFVEGDLGISVARILIDTYEGLI